MIKKLLITVCTTLCCSFLYGKQDWKIVWNDEFDYSGAPDNSKWSFDTEGNNWNWGNEEAQNYTPADKRNAWVEDGNLIIEARKEQYQWYGDGETKQYTSARLRTLGKGDWTYGKVEVKALLPTGRGMWPAIWMLPSEEKYGGWPSSGELDIMENVGFDPDKIHCNIHTEAYNHKMGTNKGNTVSTTAPSQNWHVYSMEWDADKVIFFLDGEQVFRFDNEHKTYKEWPYDQKFHLLLNIAVGGGWGGEQGIDDAIFPQRMLVDYVRVYEYGEVADEPVDGVLSLKTNITEKICQNEDAELIIDTTGTGSLLHPEDLSIKIIETLADGKINDIDMSNSFITNGLIHVIVNPSKDATYTTTISYREQKKEASSSVKVTERPNSFITGRLAACEGEKTEFETQESSVYKYEWYDSYSNKLGENSTLEIIAEESMDIILKTTYNSCEKSDTVYLKVYSRPVIASVDSIGPKDVKVELISGLGQAPYSFYINNDNARPTESDEFYDLTPRDYIVKVVDAKGCVSEKYAFTIKEQTAVDNIAASNIAVYVNGNNIQIVGAVDGTSFRLLDAKGICMIDGKISGDGIIIASSLDNGIYYIMIEGKAYPIIKR